VLWQWDIRTGKAAVLFQDPYRGQYVPPVINTLPYGVSALALDRSGEILAFGGVDGILRLIRLS
jgi:hypothetical protein